MTKISEILLKYETDKITHHNYGDAYDDIFDQFDKNTPLSILEIGTQKGGSLCAWKDYFINAKVTGLDIVDVVKPEYRRDSINYVTCDIKDWQTNDTFDIIIDDGSHFLSDVEFAVKMLLPKLNKNGFYIIEDCQQPESWMEKIKLLVGDCEIYGEDFRGHYDNYLIIIKK